jgi:hypothetical protein
LLTNNPATLKVYDMVEREVATLVNDVKETEHYSSEGEPISVGDPSELSR